MRARAAVAYTNPQYLIVALLIRKDNISCDDIDRGAKGYYEHICVQRACGTLACERTWRAACISPWLNSRVISKVRANHESASQLQCRCSIISIHQYRGKHTRHIIIKSNLNIITKLNWCVVFVLIAAFATAGIDRIKDGTSRIRFEYV